MRPGIGLACFVVEFLSRVLAVDHMYGKKVGVLFRCDLNKRFRRTGIQAGFDTIVHQVKKDTAEAKHCFQYSFFLGAAVENWSGHYVLLPAGVYCPESH